MKKENDFDIYSLMRSEEIREYYRKNVPLSVDEQACIITNSYNSLTEKLSLLNRLNFHVNDSSEHKKEIINLITLYQLLNKIYYKPHDFFGNDCTILYVVHGLVFRCNLNANTNLSTDFFDNYAYSNLYYNNINDVTEFMNECKYKVYEVELIIIKGDHIQYPISFDCSDIEGEYMPFSCAYSDELFNEYNIQDALDIDMSLFCVSHKGLPFEDGCKIKFQLPFMDHPFCGIIKNDIDGNGCWYNFVYREDNLELNQEYCDFLDMSYSRIDNSDYAVVDWLERS